MEPYPETLSLDLSFREYSESHSIVHGRVGLFHISLVIGINGAEGFVTHEKSRFSAKRNTASLTNSEGALFVLNLNSEKISSVCRSM